MFNRLYFVTLRWGDNLKVCIQMLWYANTICDQAIKWYECDWVFKLYTIYYWFLDIWLMLCSPGIPPYPTTLILPVQSQASFVLSLSLLDNYLRRLRSCLWCFLMVWNSFQSMTPTFVSLIMLLYWFSSFYILEYIINCDAMNQARHQTS